MTELRIHASAFKKNIYQICILILKLNNYGGIIQKADQWLQLQIFAQQRDLSDHLPFT